ncbi:MAG: hypothetical protein LPK07_06195 [Hymenobacteraceae bacterium]|nr:hypothetical protein [Hymenobacteraceae bacterium]
MEGYFDTATAIALAEGGAKILALRTVLVQIIGLDCRHLALGKGCAFIRTWQARHGQHYKRPYDSQVLHYCKGKNNFAIALSA